MFGSKKNSIIVISAILLFSAISVILQGTQWDTIFYIFAFIVPIVFVVFNRKNNPYEVRIKSGARLMVVGLFLYVVSTLLEIYFKHL